MSDGVVYETVILTSHRLSNNDIGEINQLVAELLKRRVRYDTRTLMSEEVLEPVTVAVVPTGRIFDLDLRPSTLAARYE